jgi:hypothetical protein
MIKAFVILVLVLCAGGVFAQAPVIDHLEVDEVKQQLKIFGTISSLSGEVTIDDTLVNIVSWTDSLIIVMLPDSGRGSGGDVIIKDINGSSNKRTLSVFKATILNTLFYYYNNPNIGGYSNVDDRFWHTVWRADIGRRNSISDSLVRFELSRSSYGIRSRNGYIDIGLRWADTSSIADSSVSMSGSINLVQNKVIIDSAVLRSTVPSPYLYRISYIPWQIKFDSSGYLSGYIDTAYCPSPTGPDLCRNNRLYNQQLLFPPSPKSAVRDAKLMDDGVTAIFEVIDNKVKIILSTPKQTDAAISLVGIRRGQVMFLEVSIKGIKRYFKLPFVF